MLNRAPFAPLVSALAALVTLLPADGVQAGDGWQVVDNERGIEVALREVPGRDLPTMRGKGKLKGDVLSALMVILDAKRGPEWAEGANESHIVKDIDARTALVYSYTKLTWPVSDRDMVLERKIQVIAPGEEYRVVMTAKPKATKSKDGVIRIQTGELFFHVKKVSENEIWMEYQVSIDPGGSLPKWLVRWASKSIPFETFVALEAQMKKTQKDYGAERKVWAAAQP